MSQKVLWEKRIACGAWLRIVHGDITRETVDSIVNAANSQLVHGGGVAGAIVRAGGESIQRESDALAPIAVGSAVLTPAGRLAARAVIHAVGPRMGEGDEDAKLCGAVRSALDIASERNFVSISMPAISSGIFGYPKERCAEMLLATTLRFFDETPETTLRDVRFCNFDAPTCAAFLEHFRREMGE